MLTTINDSTKNNFIASLAKNADIIKDGLNINQILLGAGIAIIPTNLGGSIDAKSEEQKLIQYYSLNFDVWYTIAKYALSNMHSSVAETASFAQQLAARFIPTFVTNKLSMSTLVNASSRIQSAALIPTYNFVPNMLSPFNSRLYNRTFVIDTAYSIEANFDPILVGTAITMGVYNTESTLVDSFTATIDAYGFANFSYIPSKVLTAGIYFLGINSFVMFNKADYVSAVGYVSSFAGATLSSARVANNSPLIARVGDIISPLVASLNAKHYINSSSFVSVNIAQNINAVSSEVVRIL